MHLKTAVAFILLSVPAYALSVVPFVAPHNSYAAAYEFFPDAPNVSIVSYTFSSPDIAAMLVDAEREGGEVQLLVEGGPVGGITEMLPLLCALADAGVEVRLYKGAFRYMHAKYAVSGSRVLITTENLGTDGFPPDGKGNKGYGIILDDEKIAEELLRIFENDVKDSEEVDCEGVQKMQLKEPAGADAQLQELAADSAELVTAPLDNNGIAEIAALLEGTKGFLYIEQFYIQPWQSSRNPFLEAAIDAARNGTAVRILLDSTWYNNRKNDPKSNSATAAYANQIAEDESLDVEAKVYDGEAYEKIHSKMVIGGSYAFVSSINWNENSPKNNREIGVIVRGGDISKFYRAFFEEDYGIRPKLPLPAGLAVAPADRNFIIIMISGLFGLALLALFWWKGRK